MDGKLVENGSQERGQEVVGWIFLTLDWDQWAGSPTQDYLYKKQKC
jgi:hypothetical protein